MPFHSNAHRLHAGCTVQAVQAVLATLALATLQAQAAPLGSAATLTGHVAQVLPLPALRVQPEQGPAVDVLLEGLDWPWPCQPGGAEARQALHEWAHAREVTVKLHGPVRHGQARGTVSIGGQVLNRRLVEEGHAFSTRTRWDQGPYVKQERQAQALARGVFVDGRALRPAEYQRQHGPCR